MWYRNHHHCGAEHFGEHVYHQAAPATMPQKVATGPSNPALSQYMTDHHGPAYHTSSRKQEDAHIDKRHRCTPLPGLTQTHPYAAGS